MREYVDGQSSIRDSICTDPLACATTTSAASSDSSPSLSCNLENELRRFRCSPVASSSSGSANERLGRSFDLPDMPGALHTSNQPITYQRTAEVLALPAKGRGCATIPENKVTQPKNGCGGSHCEQLSMCVCYSSRRRAVTGHEVCVIARVFKYLNG